MSYREFTEIPAWQAARSYKLAIYALCAQAPLATDVDLRNQLRTCVRKPPGQIAEAYARFNPADAARVLTIATAELVESQNHLIDAADLDYISEPTRLAHHKHAQDVIDQIEGWRAYLQSPDALRNVRTIRDQAWKRRRVPATNPNPNMNMNMNPNMNPNPNRNTNPNPNPNPNPNLNPNGNPRNPNPKRNPRNPNPKRNPNRNSNPNE